MDHKGTQQGGPGGNGRGEKERGEAPVPLCHFPSVRPERLPVLCGFSSEPSCFRVPTEGPPVQPLTPVSSPSDDAQEAQLPREPGHTACWTRGACVDQPLGPRSLPRSLWGRRAPMRL